LSIYALERLVILNSHGSILSDIGVELKVLVKSSGSLYGEPESAADISGDFRDIGDDTLASDII